MVDKVVRGAYQLDSVVDVLNDIEDLRESYYFYFGMVMAL